jgi:thiamine kinase-like enzyme
MKTKSKFTAFIIMKRLKISLSDTLLQVNKDKRNKLIYNLINLVNSLNNLGILHNDVHFDNVMINNNQLVLIDFDGSIKSNEKDIIKFTFLQRGLF